MTTLPAASTPLPPLPAVPPTPPLPPLPPEPPPFPVQSQVTPAPPLPPCWPAPPCPPLPPGPPGPDSVKTVSWLAVRWLEMVIVAHWLASVSAQPLSQASQRRSDPAANGSTTASVRSTVGLPRGQWSASVAEAALVAQFSRWRERSGACCSAW